MRISPFQAVFPNLDYITSAESFFASVKTEYPEYAKSGLFEKRSREGIYIYRIKKPTREHTGLIACSDMRDYLDGRIVKHENTLAAKEQKQLQLMLRRQAMVKPILLTYPPVSAIQEWVRRNVTDRPPTFEVSFPEEEQTHAFWEVLDGTEIQEICALFREKVARAYIADGHHRTASAALLDAKRKETDRLPLLSAFFPTTELDIHDFNRVVEGLEELSLTRFMAYLSQLFNIEPTDAPQKPLAKHELLMFVNREWYRLRWRAEILEAADSERPDALLDAYLLNERVFCDIFGIADVRTDLRVDYVEGPKGLDGLRRKTQRNPLAVGFALHPVKIEDLLRVADSESVMPPKSTWFEPRIKNGLIVLEI